MTIQDVHSVVAFVFDDGDTEATAEKGADKTELQ